MADKKPRLPTVNLLILKREGVYKHFDLMVAMGGFDDFAGAKLDRQQAARRVKAREDFQSTPHPSIQISLGSVAQR